MKGKIQMEREEEIKKRKRGASVGKGYERWELGMEKEKHIMDGIGKETEGCESGNERGRDVRAGMREREGCESGNERDGDVEEE